MDPIYFDNQATTQIHPDVIDTIEAVMRRGLANPASQHEFGRVARQTLEGYREQISGRLGLGTDDRCIFTSGGTESNNLALLGGFSPAGGNFANTNVVCSAIEHPSVLGVLEYLKQQKVEIRSISPDRNGSICPQAFEDNINDDTRLAVCMLANHETGVIQPVQEIASICSERRVPFHVDAVQAIGKLPFHFTEIGCSSASVSAHKFHGPTGIGLLLTRPDCQLAPLLHGGFQQEGIRPGTENIPLAAGICRAIELSTSLLAENIATLRLLRDQFEQRLCERFPAIVVNGQDANRLPNASNMSFLDLDRQRFVLAADRVGLACSTGSACSSGSSQPSHVLTAMGCDKPVIDTAVRFGFSVRNRPEEIDIAIERISSILSPKKP